MNQNEILELLSEATNNNKQAMLDALQDGQALLSLGITDKDTEAVECAYAIINQALNDQFETLLIDACKQHLKPTIEPYHYANVTLDQLFDGITYGQYYFEIPARDTHEKLPVVVHLK